MKKINFEVSLKPFTDLSHDGIMNTCARIYSNWEILMERFEEIGILLWVGDGNEILEWSGNLNDELSWGKTIGFCNYNLHEVYDPEVTGYGMQKAVQYKDRIPTLHYRDLKNIIGCLRKTFSIRSGKRIYIGATIDPGPEFALANFKLVRHPECLVSKELRKRFPVPMLFMTHQAVLEGDDFRYAAFPKGLPQDTSMGKFLGMQLKEAFKDLGYDYVWFSNGFGFSHSPWCSRGEVFDGRSFDRSEADRQLKKHARFWADFRKAFPDCRIEVRGTNYSVGMDISTDATSHRLVKEKGKIATLPPNLPNLSEAVGLEMSVFMSRNCKSGDGKFLFRYYLNDPWFMSNPWYDRYCRDPYDIFCPLTISRVNADGKVSVPDSFSILTIDTERGELIKDEAAEVTGYFVRAFNEMPDEPAPVILVYPYDEYHDILEKKTGSLSTPFAHDWYLTQAITGGMPLNTVMSTDTFVKLKRDRRLPDASYVMPVPEKDWAFSKNVCEFARNGGKVLLYGSLKNASAELLEMLEIKIGREIEGDFKVEKLDGIDISLESKKDVHPLRHRSIVSGGGLAEISKGANVLISVSLKGEKRAYAVSCSNKAWKNGRIAWIRGTASFEPVSKSANPQFDNSSKFQTPGSWMRIMLSELGWTISNIRPDGNEREAYVFIKRFDNAFYFAGHKPDAAVRFKIGTPHGAPVFSETETVIDREGCSLDTFGKTFYNEVRLFVRMKSGKIKAKESPCQIGFKRQTGYHGFKNADIRIFPGKSAIGTRELAVFSKFWEQEKVKPKYNQKEKCFEIRNYTGDLHVTW
ncbi:MAG TPA: hypothetical protein DCZ94_20965 [Lentisphaeria bacterium]|nr:MAG: hypothetical protein A2X48_23170 [Lentisphaerae bacterium GWF2_49_21]HBC89418.1 hypothetical protein [Lentisphaeria bacterium]